MSGPILSAAQSACQSVAQLYRSVTSMKKARDRFNVACFPLPDQRVASFCTMTDMQRAEALQISKELTKRVVEAEGAALDSG